MSQRQMLTGQLFKYRLTSVKEDSRNLPLNRGSVTADVFLTWTTVPKFHQNWVNNSWDMPDMDKSHQNKCYQDKCPCVAVLDVTEKETYVYSFTKLGQ